MCSAHATISCEDVRRNKSPKLVCRCAGCRETLVLEWKIRERSDEFWVKQPGLSEPIFFFFFLVTFWSLSRSTRLVLTARNCGKISEIADESGLRSRVNHRTKQGSRLMGP